MSLLERPRLRRETPAEPGADQPSRPRRRGRWVAGAVGVVAAGLVLAPYAVQLEPTAAELPEGAGPMVPGYGPHGVYGLDYRFGETVTMSMPLANASALPWRITDVELVEPAYPLLEPVGGTFDPVTLMPFGEVSVDLSFEYTNCRYYHERANNTYDQVLVTGTVLGREVTRTIDLTVPMVVHSQVIMNCPDRTLIRGDDRRI